ncbi:L,D-transpeptidase [Akkermansiaceae bacterium]|nr:L,D-transpeptidase [Akkermansiaceae bacterium]MDB4623938.1 L,D-transpeptidase [Akkermansiaceae bacterium]MDB4666519.1 L,D-transpeptidase [bacterium]MDB4734620.1 L,D-transpeptidase [Akkermansiaceae bacterium]MDC0270245.1 L,D-transpeptidase [bacterium]
MKSLFLYLPLLVTLTSCVSHGPKDPKATGYKVRGIYYWLAKADETKVKISLWDQKAWLLNGDGKAILETDVSTGVPGKETPEGIFPILERIEEKRSNRYGKFVNIETREVVVEKAWEHQGEVPEGSEYEGIAMPYWMRLTWYGIGMHVGEFNKRARASFGCVRVVDEAQEKIYRKTMLGTEVEVVADSLQPLHGL